MAFGAFATDTRRATNRRLAGNIATVLSDLGQKIDPEQLAALSALVERPVVQRLD
jgi:hypothetical protein